jgi:hypothetical protein
MVARRCFDINPALNNHPIEMAHGFAPKGKS